MKKEEFEKAYGREWAEGEDLKDAYTDESGENSVGFPGNKMPVITIEQPNLIQNYQFGFIPAWTDPEKLNEIRNTFNARIETIAELPTWRDAWRKGQRCLVCTNGFFEHDKKRKTKVFIHLKEMEHFYYAGIYGHYLNKKTGEIIRSMAVITTVPNSLIEPVHHRMPVIIKPGDEGIWMDPAADPHHLLLQYSQPMSPVFMVMEDVAEKPKKPWQGELF